MSYFLTDNWQPERANFPSLYLVDKVWYSRWAGVVPAPAFELFSRTNEAYFDNRAFVSNLTISDEFHNEKTLAVLRDIVSNFPVEKMTLISVARKNTLTASQYSLTTNIPEAVESIRIMAPARGSVAMINLSPLRGSSVLTDEYIGQQLVKLTDAGCVVLVSAGNEGQLLPVSTTFLDSKIVVVGGYTVGAGNVNRHDSNYGPGVTCYMPTPISLRLYNVDMSYEQSSAATAQLTGVVLLMQNYAYSRGRFLTPAEVKNLLSTRGTPISISVGNQTVRGFTPKWSSLKAGIDSIIRMQRPARVDQRPGR